MNTGDVMLRPASSGLNIRMLLVFAAISLGTLWAADSVQYPDNFRRWVHVGTGVILPGGILWLQLVAKRPKLRIPRERF